MRITATLIPQRCGKAGGGAGWFNALGCYLFRSGLFGVLGATILGIGLFGNGLFSNSIVGNSVFRPFVAGRSDFEGFRVNGRRALDEDLRSGRGSSGLEFYDGDAHIGCGVSVHGRLGFLYNGRNHRLGSGCDRLRLGSRDHRFGRQLRLRHFRLGSFFDIGVRLRLAVL